MGSSLLDLGPERLLKVFVAIPGLFLMVFVPQKHTSSNFFWSAGVTVFRPDVFFSQLAPTLMLASRFFSGRILRSKQEGMGGISKLI